MHFEDLQQFPPGHPPSPYPQPMVCETVSGTVSVQALPEGLVLRAVGWLGSELPSEGRVPSACIERLQTAHESGWIFSDGTLGTHECGICGDRSLAEVRHAGPTSHHCREPFGHGHHLVLWKHIVYMCPAMILHYIETHGYRPPDEFLEAVSRGRFLTGEDFALA